MKTPQEKAIEELCSESSAIRRWFRNHGTDYLSMPQWIRDRLTAKTKAVESIYTQMSFELADRQAYPHVDNMGVTNETTPMSEVNENE